MNPIKRHGPSIAFSTLTLLWAGGGLVASCRPKRRRNRSRSGRAAHPVSNRGGMNRRKRGTTGSATSTIRRSRRSCHQPTKRRAQRSSSCPAAVTASWSSTLRDATPQSFSISSASRPSCSSIGWCAKRIRRTNWRRTSGKTPIARCGWCAAGPASGTSIPIASACSASPPAAKSWRWSPTTRDSAIPTRRIRSTGRMAARIFRSSSIPARSGFRTKACRQSRRRC